jgi:hypothetical protein
MLPKKLDGTPPVKYDFTVCTLVNDAVEYSEMITSFEKAGFVSGDTEYIYADNSTGNEFDAYTGLNRFLQEAQGKYIIICHQDILLIDNKTMLVNCIENINKLDSNWAVLSNAGAIGPNYLSMLISYPDEKIVHKGRPPEKVKSVDENFILIKSSANLALSGDLHGFHMYGTDLCLIADLLGYSSYTIPFNLLHKSEGNVSQDFWEGKRSIQRKYNSKLTGRWIQTTISQFYISGSLIERIINGNLLVLLLIKGFNSLKKKRRH